MEEKESIPQLDLDVCLSLLLVNLGDVEVSLNIDTIGLVRALVRFDPIETAMKIRSITDAQNLVELIFCLNKNECFRSWFGAAAQNATRLAFSIYGRVPLLPRSLFLNSADLDIDKRKYQGKAVVIWNYKSQINGERNYFNTFVWGSLSHDNMALLGICSTQSGMTEILASPWNTWGIYEWRQHNNASVSKIQQIFFEVARALRYIHSLGIVSSNRIIESGLYLHSNNHAKVVCPGFCPNNLCKGQLDYNGYDDFATLEDVIRSFAVLFYQILFDEEVYRTPTIRPSEPEIPDNVWQFIQWCCTEDPKERPTIDQVVQEMESWISLGQFTLTTLVVDNW